MVLGTHVMDLMRFIAGDARWCFAKVGVTGAERVAPISKANVREGAEGMGPLAGVRDRFGLTILGSLGVIQVTTGSLPAAYFLSDPSWFPGRSRAQWQEITSQGVGKPETLKDGGLGQGNVWIAQDLIDSIERDRQPKGSVYDGRAALEMIMAIYESQRVRGPVELPLRNRRNPLTML
jgi:hypothetical protein